MISVRAETRSDHDSVGELIKSAFSASDLGYHGEAELVGQLRRACPEVLSLVAENGDRIVGHILFSPVVLRTRTEEIAGMGLAPMAVLPESQGAGVGKALIESGLQRLSQSHCNFVAVIGHADYYPRFGFLPAAGVEVVHGFDGVPQELLFIRILDEAARPTIQNGTVLFRPEFGAQNSAEA